MVVSEKIQSFIERSSWIREMFEAGIRLKAEVGAENVCDFSLGNPDLEPPAAFKDALLDLIQNEPAGIHGYMPNAGFPDVREQVAGYAARVYGQDFTAEDIVMTCGAGGALNVAFKALLTPGDEIIVPRPYFVEYNFYADNHQAEVKLVDTDPDFSLNLSRIEAALSDKTRVVLINSPNNPTGAVYPAETIAGLCDLLAGASRRYGRPIFLVSDEPYRKIAYDGVEVPSVFGDYPYVIALTSYSKDLSLPGERIGFLAAHPKVPDKSLLMAGLVLANRILGFVNAPALMQRAVARLQGVSVDVGVYQNRRDAFVAGLKEAGYELVRPQGAFYLFPKTPIPDDVAFVKRLQKENILAVPGSGFGGPGHIRLTYCVPESVIERSLAGFKRARENPNP